MRILFDTNVLLDALLARDPFLEDARVLFEAVEAGQLKGFISATTITDIYYLVRRQTQSDEVTLAAVTRLLALMEICLVDRAVLEQAIALRFQDFEDAVQIACAITSRLDVIVTRDQAGFTGATIAVMSPRELSRRLVQ